MGPADGAAAPLEQDKLVPEGYFDPGGEVWYDPKMLFSARSARKKSKMMCQDHVDIKNKFRVEFREHFIINKSKHEQSQTKEARVEKIGKY